MIPISADDTNYSRYHHFHTVSSFVHPHPLHPPQKTLFQVMKTTFMTSISTHILFDPPPETILEHHAILPCAGVAQFFAAMPYQEVVSICLIIHTFDQNDFI